MRRPFVYFRIFLFLFCLPLLNCAVSLPANSAVGKGRLTPCPASPNCVNSQADKADVHYIAPLALSDSANGWQALKKAVGKLPRTHVVRDSGGYMHVTFTSYLWRFVDDVEFAQAGSFIHVRSASRLGHSDLGANRRRVEKIRQVIGERGNKN